MSEDDDKTVLKNFRNSILDTKKNNKTGIYINTEYAKDINNIRNWLSDINEKGLTELKDIKQYFADLNDKEIYGKTLAKYSGIISSIMNCKQFEDNHRIQFNSNLFLYKLNHYVLAPGITSKCVTNDILYMQMIAVSATANDEISQKLFKISSLGGAMVVSNNFNSQMSYKGYIQDYDADFSAICNRTVPLSIIQRIISEKPNDFFFELSGDTYRCFGNENVYIICKEGTNDAEILQKYQNMKYIKNENNKLALGEKQIAYNEGLYYIDKNVVAENFCPAYITFDNDVTFKYLFYYEIDYNLLFEYLEKNPWPNNLCYWDTINYCFDFLFVFSLTSNKSRKDKKDIQDWCLTYLRLKPYISRWKDNQLLFARIINDFMYGFLNDSSYSRFLHLEKRCVKYLAVLTKLRNEGMFTEITNFFSSIPFATFIKNQLQDNVFSLAKDIKSVASAFVNGSKPLNIVEKVRAVAMKIMDILPKDDLSTACFPMIFAGGALVGDNIKRNDPKSDPVLVQLARNYAIQTRSKKKQRGEIENIISENEKLDKKIDAFIEGYIKRKTRTSPLKDDILLNLNAIRNDIRGRLLDKDEVTRNFMTDVLKWSKDITKEVPINKKQPIIDAHLTWWTKEIKRLAEIDKNKKRKELVEDEGEDEGEDEMEDESKQVKVLGKKRKKV